MQFEAPLTHAKLIKRYKRFLADCLLDDGQMITAHIANSGSMMGLAEAGSDIYLLPNQNPKAKLNWRWELVKVNDHLVGLNTARPNAIVSEAINNSQIPELSGFNSLRREVKYGENSRIDILLENHKQELCYVEVKSVTLKQGQNAAFPDAITKRGAKHLVELENMVNIGHRAVMFYLIQRSDCNTFQIAKDIDPEYYKALKKAQNRGVEILCYQSQLSLEGIEVEKAVEIII